MVVPNCLHGRRDSTHLGDRKRILFRTIGTLYSGVPCVDIDYLCFYLQQMQINMRIHVQSSGKFTVSSVLVSIRAAADDYFHNDESSSYFYD